MTGAQATCSASSASPAIVSGLHRDGAPRPHPIGGVNRTGHFLVRCGRMCNHAISRAYLKVARLSEQDEDQKKETEQVWEHVKTLRRRVAQLN